MKTLTALEDKNRFGQLIEAAQRQPVTVTKQGRGSVVVMSVELYERRRRRAWKTCSPLPTKPVAPHAGAV